MFGDDRQTECSIDHRSTFDERINTSTAIDPAGVKVRGWSNRRAKDFSRSPEGLA
jgi:hypothetical protein